MDDGRDDYDRKGDSSAEETGQYRIEAMSEPSRVPRGPGREGTLPVSAKGYRSEGGPPQKWMNFYTKVLSAIRLISRPEAGGFVPGRAGEEEKMAKIEEAKAALRELGLSEDSRPRRMIVSL